MNNQLALKCGADQLLKKWRTRRLPLRAGLLVMLGCVLGVPPLPAQTQEEEMRSMRLELRQLRQELDTLRDEVRQLKAPAVQPQPAGAPQQPRGQEAAQASPQTVPESGSAEVTSVADALPLLQAQVAEQAQTKVESNSKLPVKIFGTIVSNTFVNTGEVNWLENPNIVVPAPASLPAGSFSSTLRQSRIGAVVEGPTIGSAKVNGFFAVDFLGGVPNFQTGQVMGIPRLLYAFVRVEGAKTALEVGQDQMILAPRNPTSLAAMSFPDLYRSGNLYLRAPQVRVEHTFSAGKSGDILAVGGIMAPVAGDFASNALTFVPPNLAGERSRWPALQARLAWRGRPAGVGEDKGWEIGVSGHYGRERYIASVTPSWATALDFDAHSGRVGLGGEWFVGRNLDAFGGALGQLAKSTGGFFEGRLRATPRLEFNSGFGKDRLFDLSGYKVTMAGNTGVYANTIFRWTPELASSIEYRWLSTVPTQGAARRNNHINFVFAYSF